MIKKLKIGLLVAVLSLAITSSALAANLTYSSDTPAYLSTAGYTLTIKSGSTATTVIVGASTLRFTMPVSSTFTVTSRNDIDITTNDGASTNTNTCASNLNTVVITTSDAQTPDITLTPNGGVCASSSGGGGSSGGGSSGGSTTTTVAATPATPATPAVPGTVIAGCGNRTTGFSTSIAGQSCAGNTSTTPATPATPATSATPSTTTGSYNLGTATIKNGSRGEAAKELQRFLNDKLNLGLVLDGIIGPKTIAVIKQWQSDNGLVADGLIGAKTKAMMNAGVTPATPASPSTTTGSYNLGTATLKNGSRGEAVKELQRFLNDKLNLGLALDGVLGSKTIAVIKQWQSDNGLVADGLIGAKTKAMMNAQ